MKKKAIIMGMPVTVNIADKNSTDADIEDLFLYFRKIDEKFSIYKKTSEISKINKGIITKKYSLEMRKILALCEQTKKETNGYFDIFHNGKYDPSGLVKGWAIYQASKILIKKGYRNFFIEIAGDIQTFGANENGKKWKVGIENPFDRSEIIKVLLLSGQGIATSGAYIRGSHIYNPITKKPADEIKSITVIGKNVYEADRFATAVFAMGKKGIEFLNKLKGFEGYMVTHDWQALYTKGFTKYAG